jgi:hypothetical protein
LTVKWLQPGERCGNAEACGSIPTANGAYATIRAPKPKGWGDERAVCQLGHELLHTLGARHPQAPIYASGVVR